MSEPTRPEPELLRWAERTAGRGARVLACEALKLKETQQTWLLRLEQRETESTAVLKTSPLGWYAGVASEAAALRLAEQHGLPVPRLPGVDLEGQAGVLVVLSTALPGDSALPAEPPLRRLRGLGAAAARLHGIGLAASPELPHHTRPVPYDPYIEDRRDGRAPTTPLIETAERLVGQYALPDDDDARTVLLHGDYHLANTMWIGDAFAGYVDWDTAGVGDPGVDLGWSRLDTALHYSLDAADQIVRGWIDVMGREPDHLAYWDLTAALQTTADAGQYTAERDAFLRAALARI